ncbi:TonB-dependent receptor [Granulicella sp. 5B5]|uniref:TonB-dependent receptor n=1 Tax=Granulicella sp. 5B5 TaxID=1617967 RepID=UPI0015F63397|nr:TonB-dependent receptor [Granulicella sp. 5B5]QMV18443.1 TonB-dependent receptor [Granulicella sp. 5B5]
MYQRKRCTRLLAICAAALLAAGAAYGQTITGTVRGVVTDQSGAAVPEARVTAVNVNTGVQTSTTSDRTGTYNIQTLAIGTYRVTATRKGFEVSSTNPFSLEIDQIAKVNLKLQVGEVSTTVDVAADSGTILQTEDASLGTTITANTLESMPLPGQNFSAATVFVPGAVLPTYGSLGSTQGTERDTSFASSTQPSFNGNRMQTNNYIFDGTDINEPLQNTIAYNPAPEAIGQMRVITGNPDAEYGNVNGGEILAVTKSGTNKFHGSAYAFYENQDGTANTWSNDYNKIAKGVFHQNLFGGTIGGPVFKNKLFFFADYEGFRQTTAGTSVISLPTPRMRTGDFSEFLGTPDQYGHVIGTGTGGIGTAAYIQLYNTTNGTTAATPYVNNQIPVNNPVAQFVFATPSFYPLPNRPSTNVNSPDTNNYGGYNKTATVNNQGDIRVDYVATSKDNIMARFTHGGSYDKPIVSVLAFQFPGGDDYPFWNGVLNEVHTFSPNLQNEFRAGYSRISNLSGIPSDPFGNFPAGSDTKVGYPYASPYPGFTETNISSAEKNIGTLGVVQDTIDNIFDYGDTVTWLHGKHIIKGGAQILRYQENYYYASNNGNMGQFAYNGEFTRANGSNGYGFADFVIDASELQAVSGTAGRDGQRQYRMAYFGEDEWKVTPKLTLNIGLRYGYDQPMYEVNGKEVNVDVKNPQNCPNCLLVAGKNGASNALYNAYHTQFMPRVSFAYQMNPQMVIRGGYGITDDFEGMGAAQRLTQNPPFIPQYSYSSTAPSATSGGTPVRVSQGFNVGGLTPGASNKYEAWDPNIKPELIQQYNLTLQTLMGRNFTFQIGYVGNVAQHLVVPEPYNQQTIPGSANTATQPFKALVGVGGQVYLTLAEGYSNYNALQVQLRQRQWHGLEYTFNYTFSKNMTNNPGYFGTGGVDGPGTYPQNIYDPHGDYGVAAFDTRNAANFVGTYALPFGHGRDYGSHANRFVDWAIGGWKVSTEAVLYSGFPITIGASNNSQSNNGGGARANQYHQLHIVNRSLAHWFGTGPDVLPCLATTAPASGGPPVNTNGAPCAYGAELTASFGTAHVGTERAPGYRVVDSSMFKQFRTYKEQFIQIRIDAFNVGNIASYAAPGSTATTTSTFGQITSTLSPARQLQYSLKYEF